MKKKKVDAFIKAKVAEAQHAAFAAGRKSKEQEYELLIEPPRDGSDICILGEKPKGMIYRVAINSAYAPRLFDPNKIEPFYRHDSMQVATFVPIQKCQSFGNGQMVVWYEWQFRGF